MTRLRKREGEKEIRYKALLKCVLAGISIFLMVLFIRPFLSGYFVSSPQIKENKLLWASRITAEDARYHYLLGLLYYSPRDKSGIERAISRFSISLKRNPTDARVWIAIAKAYRDSGKPEHAEYAVRKAIYMNRNNPALVWESGVFYLLEDKPVEATKFLKRYISMVPNDQENVYFLFYSMKMAPMFIRENLLPSEHAFYKRYLNFLETNRLLNESLELWRTTKSFRPERTDYISYCNFLIKTGEIKDALTLWDDFVKRFGVRDDKSHSDSETIWNGDFELPLEDGCFDWRIGSADGVKVFIDRDIKRTGYSSLSANFDGKHNPGLYIAEQIAPVQPGKRYKVIGYIKTENITTQNGIFLNVAGYRCVPFAKRTESVTGTDLWKKMEVEFSAPGNCKAIKIGMGRERSEKFDNKISGDVWIDSITMNSIEN